MAEPFAVAVVGAGFSGVMVAAHLLAGRPARPVRVLTVNRSGRAARGVAYGTSSPRHLLNVPAGRMSAFPDRPSHFADYAHARLPDATAASFVPRSVYGDYLEAVLADAVADAGPNRLDRAVAEARAVRPAGDGAELDLSDGRTVRADRVVLAVGHYPPADPPGLSPAVIASPRYVRDPWAAGAFDRVPADAPVLLVGTGLTMLDVALDLHARGLPGAVAVSRRGLVPRPHVVGLSPAEPVHRPELENVATARGYLRAVRRQVRTVEAAGGDWRQVVDSLRPLTPALWRRLSLHERRRFLRHLRPHWEVHRHRVAPATAAAVDDLRAGGWLTVRAGRLVGAELTAGGVTVGVMPRGGGPAETLAVGAVVNCTGPATELTGDPLLTDLFARGLARPDPLGLGLDVADDGSVVGADGRPSAVLSAVGPLLRGRDGEATAVPELRVHAATLAARLLAVVTGWPC